MRNYLITGVSGSGKTAVGARLMEAGYAVAQGDDALVIPGGIGWNWDADRVLTWMQKPGVVFFCGGADNQDEFLPLFRKVFILDVPDGAAKQRLAGRATGPAGPRHRTLSPHANVQVIDAKRSVSAVVFDILRGL